MNPRTTRQGRLAEVGASGNAKLEASCVHLACKGTARAYERSYLAGAGVWQIVETIPPNNPLTKRPPPPDLCPEAAALWEGSEAALCTILQVLESS